MWPWTLASRRQDPGQDEGPLHGVPVHPTRRKLSSHLNRGQAPRALGGGGGEANWGHASLGLLGDTRGSAVTGTQARLAESAAGGHRLPKCQPSLPDPPVPWYNRPPPRTCQFMRTAERPGGGAADGTWGDTGNSPVAGSQWAPGHCQHGYHSCPSSLPRASPALPGHLVQPPGGRRCSGCPSTAPVPPSLLGHTGVKTRSQSPGASLKPRAGWAEAALSQRQGRHSGRSKSSSQDPEALCFLPAHPGPAWPGSAHHRMALDISQLEVGSAGHPLHPLQKQACASWSPGQSQLVPGWGSARSENELPAPGSVQIRLMEFCTLSFQTLRPQGPTSPLSSVPTEE